MGMKNMNYLILMALLFFSCKKENSKHWTEVNIKANNYLTGEPITDVACGVFYSKAGFFLNVETIALHEGFTENGQYSFGFKAKKNGFYQAEAAFEYGKYYVINFSNYLYLDYGEVNNFQFDLVPYGFLKLDIKNLSCFDSNDKMKFMRENLEVSNDDTNWSSDRLGCYTYTSPDYFKVPIGTHKYTWNVTKNNVTTEYTNTIIVQENEYLSFNIYY